MKFQEKLLYVIAKLNLSQTELARELGVWLIVLKEHRVGIGFLLCVPVSLLLGYILQ